MDIICSECGQSFSLSLSEVSGMSITESLYCSPSCFSAAVTDREKDVKKLNMPFVRRLSESNLLTDAGYSDYAVWSDKLKMNFRSDFERLVALYLRKMKHRFWYERVSIKVGLQRYIPDFYLLDSFTFIEVKGVWGPGSKAKFRKAMRVISPQETIILLPMRMKNQFKKEVRI